MATKKTKTIPRSSAGGAMPVRIVGWTVSDEELDGLVEMTFRLMERFTTDPRVAMLIRLAMAAR